MSALPRLSVVTFTHGPAPLVAASLRRIRSVAYEIIVAVDHRVPVADLGPLQSVADRLIRAEFVYPLEANLAWLHQLATGDWILRLDSDDVVSAGLIRRLTTPGWDRGITHAFVPYRWLWGKPSTMLDQAPWWPDPILRLVRNQPGIATFGTAAHQVPHVSGPSRAWDEPIYHLDLLLHDEAQRRTKVWGYEQQNPGRRTDRGWAVSSTYYLPEQMRPSPKVADVPHADAAAIAQVLQAGEGSARPVPPIDRPELRVVVRADQRQAPGPSPADASVRILDHGPVTVVVGRPMTVTVGVANHSGHTWSPADVPCNVVGARLHDASGGQVGPELRAPLPGPLEPGDETLVRLTVPPDIPATATRLQVGLLQEQVAWHDSTASVELRVQRGRRVLVSTGVSSFPHLGDDLIAHEILGAIAAHLPDVVPVMLAHPTDGLGVRFGCEVVPGPAALPSPGSRAIEAGRRARDLVNQARLMARGTPPADPQVAAILQPFADGSALVLAPGGGLASRYSDEALMVCTIQALIARGFGLPVLVEGPSIGPIEVRRDHAALAQLLNDAQHLTVRDRSSADAARRIGRGIDPTVVPDPATAAMGRTDPMARRVASWVQGQGATGDRPYAVVSLRAGGNDHRHLDAVRAAVEALPPDTVTIYLPHCTGTADHDDLSLLDDPWARAALIPFATELGPRGAVALVAGAGATIGTRFHLSVLAAAAGVRALALVGDEYDRLRARGLARLPGVRVVELDNPESAAAAMADLLAGADPEPTERWDGEAFARALDRLLPAAPRL